MEPDDQGKKARKRMSITYAVAGIVLGGIGGYAWYRFVGCKTGTCPLTSRWWVTTLYGMVVGFLASGIHH